MNMDNELALKLLSEGGTFILLNAPKGIEFGIDMKVWTTGEKFQGVKMIPPGPHYIFYSSKDKYGGAAPRSGFMHVFKRSEFLIRKWDVKSEDIIMEEVSEMEVNTFRENIAHLDQFLGPYPFEIRNKWKGLSKHISDNVVQKLTPECRCIRSAVDLVRTEKKENSGTKQRWGKSRTEEERQEDFLPELVPKSGSQIRFTEMPAQRYPEGSSPAEITSHYLDSTYALNTMLSTYTNPLEFVGEIQFAFVCFLIGLNLEALEHWKRLVQLMCCCLKAIKRYVQMYTEFIICLEEQLEEIPEDFLVDIVANNNVIYRSLRDFFANVELLKDEADSKLFCECVNFKAKLTTKFGWDFTNLEEEEEDEAPVLVLP